MAILYPPILEAKALAIPYLQVATLENRYEIPFKMPDVNSVEDIGHIQVSIKYQSTNEAAVNNDYSPDGAILYINRNEGADYFKRDNNTGNYIISIPYHCFQGGRPQLGTTYCVQVRFGNNKLWTNGSGLSHRDFGGFAYWRGLQVNAVPSQFGEWSNVQTVYCYGAAAVTLSVNHNDFIPEIEYTYAPELDDPLEQVKIVYQYSDIYGSSFKSLVFNGQRQQDGVFTLRAKLPIAPVQRIFVSVEAVTKNNTVRGRTLNIFPLKYSKAIPALNGVMGDSLPLGVESNAVQEQSILVGEENGDGCLAKAFMIPKGSGLNDTDTISVYRANVYTLETIKVLEGLSAREMQVTVFKDYSVEMGEDYQYILAVKDREGKVKNLVCDIYEWGYNNPGYARLMRMDSVFLTTKNHQLRLTGNVNISTFKRVTQDQFQPTLGSKYPFYSRSGETNYRTFSLSGLITANFDPTASFLRNDPENGLWWDDESGSRLVVLNRDLYGELQFSLSRRRVSDKLNPKMQAIEQLGNHLEDEIFNNENNTIPDSFQGVFGPKTIYDEFLHRNITMAYGTSQSDENIYLERKFREYVMLWLSDGKPKLFRSETEGNMIVIISGASFTPDAKAHRMVYNLSCTVTEIADYNLENLIEYNLLPFDIQTTLLTGLPRNLKTGDVIKREDFFAIEHLMKNSFLPGETIFNFFSRLPGGIEYQVATNDPEQLARLNIILDQMDEFDFIRGEEDPYAYGSLIYQYNKNFNIPDSMAGREILPIDTRSGVKGGSGNYVFSVQSGLLPEGLTLDTKTGVISGIPVWDKDEPRPQDELILKVEDLASGKTAEMQIAVGFIYSPLVFNEIPFAIPEMILGELIPSLNVMTDGAGRPRVRGGLKFTEIPDGGTTPYVWSAKGLPKSLEINNHGVITGAFTEVTDPGTAIITVMDAAGQVQEQEIQFGQGNYPIHFFQSSKFNIPFTEVGVKMEPIDTSVGVSGGKPQISAQWPKGYKFSATGLPNGISIDPKTGIISGSPTSEGGAVNATITATDFDTPASSASIVILVQQQLKAFKFQDSQILDIGDLSGEIRLGTVIAPKQVLIEGNKLESGALIDYDTAHVGGGLPYVTPPYYRFSSEYLIPDFTIDNNGKISGRAQVASEPRTAILKVFDARGEMRKISIEIAKISSNLRFLNQQGPYRFPDTFVGQNSPNYHVEIPMDEIVGGVPPYNVSFENLPEGIVATKETAPGNQKESWVLSCPEGATSWPTAPRAAGYIIMTISDSPKLQADTQTIKVKIPFGAIVSKMEWHPTVKVIPALQEGQRLEPIYLRYVQGGLYPYTVSVVEGTLGCYQIRQTEGAEQDPNYMYIEGIADPKNPPSGIVKLQIRDASGQLSEAIPFTFGAVSDQLKLKLLNSMQAFSLIQGVSTISNRVIMTGQGGYPPYTYSMADNSLTVMDGVVLNPQDGSIRGTPQKLTKSIDISGNFKVTDSKGNVGYWDGGTPWFTPSVVEELDFAPGIRDPFEMPIYQVGAAVDRQIIKQNDHVNIRYSMTGTLPQDLQMYKGRIYGNITKTIKQTEVTITATIPKDEFTTFDQQISCRVIFPAVAGQLQLVAVPEKWSIPALSINKQMTPFVVSNGLSGGVGPYTWSLTGHVPQGLKIEYPPDGNTASVVGIPNTQTGPGIMTVTVKDKSGQSASVDLPYNGVIEQITFPDSPALDIPPKKANQDVLIDIPKIVKVTGGSGQYVFSCEDPQNLVPYMISAAGVISGNSSTESKPQRTATIKVTDAVTGVSSSITISVGAITGNIGFNGTYKIPGGKVAGKAITALNIKPGVIGGLGAPKFEIFAMPTLWDKNGGQLSIDPNSGAITGKYPTEAPASQLAIKITDSASTSTFTFAYITVDAVVKS